MLTHKNTFNLSLPLVMMSTFVKEVPVSFLEDKSLSEESRMLFRMYKQGKIWVFVQFLQNRAATSRCGKKAKWKLHL